MPKEIEAEPQQQEAEAVEREGWPDGAEDEEDEVASACAIIVLYRFVWPLDFLSSAVWSNCNCLGGGFLCTQVLQPLSKRPDIC